MAGENMFTNNIKGSEILQYEEFKFTVIQESYRFKPISDQFTGDVLRFQNSFEAREMLHMFPLCDVYFMMLTPWSGKVEWLVEH